MIPLAASAGGMVSDGSVYYLACSVAPPSCGAGAAFPGPLRFLFTSIDHLKI
jgi:hypothetical protein